MNKSTTGSPPVVADSKERKLMVKKKETVAEEAHVEQPVLNAGLKVSVRDVLAKKEEDRKRRDEERALRQANPSGSRISRLKVQADTPYFVKFLHKYNVGLELFVHMWNGDNPCNEICKIHYNETCDICKAVGTKFGESYHIPVRCFLGWVYNNVGATFDKRNDRTGEVKTYNLNPIKLIQIPLGKDDANITVLQEASRRNYFDTDVWQIERKKQKGFSIPKTLAEPGQLRTLVGRDVPLEVSEAAQKIGKEESIEIMTMILSSFDNVQWEKLGLKAPTVKTELAEVTTAATAPTLSKDDGLDA